MTVAAPEAPALAPALPGRAYRSYALGLLMVIYVVNFVDRQVVSILAELIGWPASSPMYCNDFSKDAFSFSFTSVRAGT